MFVMYAIYVGIIKSSNYEKWFLNLRDNEAQYRILTRIRRLSMGNPGDVKPAGEGVSEMRLDYGPGYRIYYKDIGENTVILYGGDKRTQQADINEAKKIAKTYEEEN